MNIQAARRATRKKSLSSKSLFSSLPVWSGTSTGEFAMSKDASAVTTASLAPAAPGSNRIVASIVRSETVTFITPSWASR